MSLANLADAAALSKGHLSSVEHGLAAITIETVERIARGLSLSPMYIFAFGEDDERARIAELIRDFPPRELGQLRRELQTRHKALVSAAAEAGAGKTAAGRKRASR
jgi:transcriptional regulator with XRE-family HTH domain